MKGNDVHNIFNILLLVKEIIFIFIETDIIYIYVCICIMYMYMYYICILAVPDPALLGF